MTYRITGLSPALFDPLFGASTAALAALGVERLIADTPNSFPDRITMRDAEPGSLLLLLNYTHQPATSPYRPSHAIFVLECATTPYDAVDEIPPVMAHRTLSLRGFCSADTIIEARVVHGSTADAALRDMLLNPKVHYIIAHNAAHGCFAGTIIRSDSPPR